MMKLVLAALAVIAAAGAATSAEAAQGCGPGLHRGPYGRCFHNGGPYGPPGLVIGTFYKLAANFLSGVALATALAFWL